MEALPCRPRKLSGSRLVWQEAPAMLIIACRACCLKESRKHFTMKRPFVLFGLVALAVAVLAFSNGLHATPNTPARLNCSAGCGHTYQMSFTILSPEHSILGKPTLSAA